MEPDGAFGPQSVAQNSLLLQGAGKLIPVIPGCPLLGASPESILPIAVTDSGLSLSLAPK